jgi:hypothetical protein
MFAIVINAIMIRDPKRHPSDHASTRISCGLVGFSTNSARATGFEIGLIMFAIYLRF